MTKFFKDAFAVSGDKTAIPNIIQVDGSVSYTEGFGFDYQRDIATEPTAKSVPRDSTNQLFFDITSALQQYQSFGIPNFITTSDNDGTPFSYSKYARVLYDDGTHGLRPYASLINANTALPSDETKWRLLDDVEGALTYPDAVFNTGVADGNIVYWDSANSRFDKALADNSAAQNVIGIADVTNNRVYLSGYTPVMTGLTPGAVYYLSSTTPGAISTVQTLQSWVRIGVAMSATALFLAPVVSPPVSAIIANAYVNSAFSIVGGNIDMLVPLDTVEFSNGVTFNGTNHTLTAEYAGKYYINGRQFTNPGVTSENLYITIYVNGVSYKRLVEINWNGNNLAIYGGCYANLSAGDVVSYYLTNSAAGSVPAGVGANFNSYGMAYLGV